MEVDLLLQNKEYNKHKVKILQFKELQMINKNIHLNHLKILVNKVLIE
jgi:hypothetical protein